MHEINSNLFTNVASVLYIIEHGKSIRKRVYGKLEVQKRRRRKMG